MKIDSETVIPLTWVLSLLAVIVSSAVAGTFWVSSVNDRLARIEDKLGIPTTHLNASLGTIIKSAQAK